MIKTPLHKQSEKACMSFKTRRASTRDYTVQVFVEYFSVEKCTTMFTPMHYTLYYTVV